MVEHTLNKKSRSITKKIKTLNESIDKIKSDHNALVDEFDSQAQVGVKQKEMHINLIKILEEEKETNQQLIEDHKEMNNIIDLTKEVICTKNSIKEELYSTRKDLSSMIQNNKSCLHQKSGEVKNIKRKYEKNNSINNEMANKVKELEINVK